MTTKIYKKVYSSSKTNSCKTNPSNSLREPLGKDKIKIRYKSNPTLNTSTQRQNLLITTSDPKTLIQNTK